MTRPERQVVAEARAALRDFGHLHPDGNLAGWKIEIDRAKKRLGCCHTAQKVISFSRHFIRLNGVEAMRDTILHEVAHALTPKDRGHGRAWRIMAAKIGAEPRRCNVDAVEPEGRYVVDCPCGSTHDRHKRPPAPGTRRCKRSGKLLTWRLRGTRLAPEIEVAVAAAEAPREDRPAGVTGSQRRLF